MVFDAIFGRRTSTFGMPPGAARIVARLRLAGATGEEQRTALEAYMELWTATDMGDARQRLEVDVWFLLSSDDDVRAHLRRWRELEGRVS